MRVTTVQSTTLATVIYDEVRAVLQLDFLSRALYQYSDVPQEVHEALLSAPSKGRYFNQAIRGRFPFARISPSPAPGPNSRPPTEPRRKPGTTPSPD
jgi:type VI protein secretion system component VasK